MESPFRSEAAAFRLLLVTIAAFALIVLASWIQPWLGVEYLKTDQPEAAIQALEQAVLLLPRDPINRSNLGLSFASTGQYDRAEQELQRALQLDAKNDTTRRLLEVVEADRRLRHHD